MLEHYLKKHGLSGTEFADISGLKQYEISRTLSGKRKPSVRIAKAIDKATGGAVPREHLRPDVFGDAA